MQNLSYGNEFDLQANKRARNIISTTMAAQQHSFMKQAPVVQRLDNAIHRINRYPVDKC